jgi:hypothetical protein
LGEEGFAGGRRGVACERESVFVVVQTSTAATSLTIFDGLAVDSGRELEVEDEGGIVTPSVGFW